MISDKSTPMRMFRIAESSQHELASAVEDLRKYYAEQTVLLDVLLASPRLGLTENELSFLEDIIEADDQSQLEPMMLNGRYEVEEEVFPDGPNFMAENDWVVQWFTGMNTFAKKLLVDKLGAMELHEKWQRLLELEFRSRELPKKVLRAVLGAPRRKKH